MNSELAYSITSTSAGHVYIGIFHNMDRADVPPLTSSSDISQIKLESISNLYY